MKKIPHLLGLLTLVFILTYSAPVFAASVVLVPELIYTGEKAEIKCTPENNHFVVTSDIIRYKNYFRFLWKDGHRKYIKAVKKGPYTKVIKGGIQPANVQKSVIFRCKAPYFKATNDGKELQNDGIYSVCSGDELKIDLVCNSQDQVKWEASQNGYVNIKVKDKNTITLEALRMGRVTLKATYLGYSYDVVIDVKPGIKKLLDKFNIFRGVADKIS